MSQYQESPGRLLEIAVGLVTSFISIVFAIAFYTLVLNAGFKYATFFAGVVLAFFTYWFGLISYRLVLNKRNKNGGLFSAGGLKLLSVFFGFSSLVVALFALHAGEFGLVLSCITMSVGSPVGWRIARQRERA